MKPYSLICFPAGGFRKCILVVDVNCDAVHQQLELLVLQVINTSNNKFQNVENCYLFGSIE